MDKIAAAQRGCAIIGSGDIDPVPGIQADGSRLLVGLAPGTLEPAQTSNGCVTGEKNIVSSGTADLLCRMEFQRAAEVTGDNGIPV